MGRRRYLASSRDGIFGDFVRVESAKGRREEVGQSGGGGRGEGSLWRILFIDFVCVTEFANPRSFVSVFEVPDQDQVTFGFQHPRDFFLLPTRVA